MSLPQYWRTPLCLAPRALHPWLTERGSLTAMLMANFPEISVKILFQGWQKAHADEAHCLNKAQIACREVLLQSKQIPLVYAHSITTSAALRRGFHLFGRTGSRPLGALLFADPTIRRSNLSWCCIDQRHPLWQKAQTAVGALPQRLWARRSTFYAGHDRLLVTEVFLPALSALPSGPIA
ncbi:chorismate--pyruvate lyase family protein [Iodobacter ciconiae]|uniref:Probable chorismate pyruvate-lyase n=1 Tax=Iodobacter ciconiae TaxID=2496266 RepID=A0A3S8ZNC8_9NEIS|nr:chorismate lyase [Iodobacter ciconiae]AZN35073.1 chorismate lyase [Iodobacter ciconiae]